MRNELLEKLRLEDLKGYNHELAELIGIEAFIKLVDVYGGTSNLYIPQANTVVIPLRDELIRREYNGENLYQLSRKWELSERSIMEITKDKAKELRRRPLDGQLSFDEIAGAG